MKIILIKIKIFIIKICFSELYYSQFITKICTEKIRKILNKNLEIDVISLFHFF